MLHDGELRKPGGLEVCAPSPSNTETRQGSKTRKNFKMTKSSLQVFRLIEEHLLRRCSLKQHMKKLPSSVQVI